MKLSEDEGGLGAKAMPPRCSSAPQPRAAVCSAPRTGHDDEAITTCSATASFGRCRCSTIASKDHGKAAFSP